MDRQQLKSELIRDENVKLFPYTDTAGKLTIGVGRNLTDVGISQEESDLLLENDIKKVEWFLDHNISWWRLLPENRQRVLANMCFNLGMAGLLEFKKFLAMAQANDDDAFDEALNSLWAKQVGERAKRLEQLWREK